MLKINEFFYSIQGEGKRVGYPSLFIRLSGCNLRCVFRNQEGEVCSKCDTPYTSFYQEKNNISYQDILDFIKENPQIKDIVFTGGEPLLQQKDMVDLIFKLVDIRKYIYITVETNGTIEPSRELLSLVDLWSISPKLKNSEPTIDDGVSESNIVYHRENRINYHLLSNIINYTEFNKSDYQIKFVYNGEWLDDEITNIISESNYHRFSRIPPENIMLMPEGMDIDEITKNNPLCI